MIKLRPHHLLCTQAYVGKGYNEEFVRNMDEKVNLLRKDSKQEIMIIKDLDSLCSHCPENKGVLCSSQNKVNTMDEKVIKYFNLDEKTYFYNDVVSRIKSEITDEIFDDICQNCEWYSFGMCKKLIVD